MTALINYLKEKNPDGIRFHEAVQLCLWLYCTLDVLPPELRAIRLGRPELAEVFANLAEQGFIIISPNLGKRIGNVAYWDGILDAFVGGMVNRDETFPERAKTYTHFDWKSAKKRQA